METNIDTCLIEIVDWFIKNRKPMTLKNIHPILAKYCGSKVEIEKFCNFLETEAGRRRFKTLLRERIKK